MLDRRTVEIMEIFEMMKMSSRIHKSLEKLAFTNTPRHTLIHILKNLFQRGLKNDQITVFQKIKRNFNSII